ncbi:MAG: hypothetical protein C0504_04180 [Candidatus Solibacter sp.]|nr:hypothetical protein [Candidatus Solibacter sp.]
MLERLDVKKVSESAAHEVRNREIHIPPVSVYRWWARRTDAVFGGVLDAFAANYDGRRLVVDPFSGGGVIPLAAILRGHQVYAQDLNPWATLGLAAMLRLPDSTQILRLKTALHAAAAEVLDSAYATIFPDGKPATIAHTIRVATAPCSRCGTRQRLFPHALVSLLHRKERERSEAILSCPQGHLFLARSDKRARCPECNSLTDPAREYTPDRKATCWKCGHAEKLQVRAEGGAWAWEVVLVERCDQSRRELDFASQAEIEQADGIRWAPTVSLGEIPDGQETKVLLRHGFRKWEDLYPRRQRVVMEALLARCLDAAGDEQLAEVLRIAVCGTAEMAGLLSRWDRWYLKSYEAMAGHRFNFTTLSVEPNVWGAPRSGRGTVGRRLRLFVKASIWLHKRIGRDLGVLGPLPAAGTGSPLRESTDACIIEGSSERMRIRPLTADLVLTDPPYHDDVQYDELSLPLRAWSQLSVAKLRNEAVVNNGNGKSAGCSNGYRTLLARLFAECHRVLKRSGRLIFSYANREPVAWCDLLSALQLAGFSGLNYAIVHSENETDHAKRGVRACTLDLLMELTSEPHSEAIPPRLNASIAGAEAEFLRLVGDTFLRIGRLEGGWEDEFARQLKDSEFLTPTSARIRQATNAKGHAVTSGQAETPRKSHLRASKRGQAPVGR